MTSRHGGQWSSILPPSAGPGVSGLCLWHHQFHLHCCCPRAMSGVRRPGLVRDGFRVHRDARAGQRDNQHLGAGRPMSSSRLSSRPTTGNSQKAATTGRPGGENLDLRSAGRGPTRPIAGILGPRPVRWLVIPFPMHNLLVPFLLPPLSTHRALQAAHSTTVCQVYHAFLVW